MSRTISILIIGFVATMVLGVLSVAALLVGRSVFVIAGADSQTTTPMVVVVETAASTQPTPTIATSATATAVPPTPFITPLPPTATATAVSVLDTPVQYVTALVDVNMRRGPGPNYDVIGWVAAGQMAKVTGVSSDSGWWRVACADGSMGNCWITAGSQYTQPANAPVTPAACTNAAAFVADVTIPDGSELPTGVSFSKTWRIKNSGTCTWDGRYHFVHAGGPTLGAVTEIMPLPASVAPGQTLDLSVQFLAPVTPGSYQSDWKLQSPEGAFFGVGQNNAPLWLKVTVVSTPTLDGSISGVVYQDRNQNGVYDSDETLVGSRQVQLFPGPACHVTSPAIAVDVTNGNGRFLFQGRFSGDYCVGLVGDHGLDDVLGISVTSGQKVENINLKSPVPNGSISGYLWADYCLTNENGDALAGNCTVDGHGDYHADGMIQPTESYISGVTILLQAGSCASSTAVQVTAVTDNFGKYFFGDLQPGIYCVSMNAAAGGNAAILLPGDWTYPARGIWFQDIEVAQGVQVHPVNFGWDYQLK